MTREQMVEDSLFAKAAARQAFQALRRGVEYTDDGYPVARILFEALSLRRHIERRLSRRWSWRRRTT